MCAANSASNEAYEAWDLVDTIVPKKYAGLLVKFGREYQPSPNASENKICFVSCVNDDEKIEQCHKYIYDLFCPPGLAIDCRIVREAPSMTAGYQAAMESSDAKYKVYLHQDTWIINRFFIWQLLWLFNERPKLGIVGVAGSRTLPKSGRWWDGEKVGMITENGTGLLNTEIYSDEGDAILLDGLLLATQYDIPWRTDIFTKWHGYDAGACLEFRRRGYEATILPQRSPACIHWCGKGSVDREYEGERQKLLHEYSSEFRLPEPPIASRRPNPTRGAAP